MRGGLALVGLPKRLTKNAYNGPYSEAIFKYYPSVLKIIAENSPYGYLSSDSSYTWAYGLYKNGVFMYVQDYSEAVDPELKGSWFSNPTATIKSDSYTYTIFPTMTTEGTWSEVEEAPADICRLIENTVYKLCQHSKEVLKNLVENYNKEVKETIKVWEEYYKGVV